MTPLVVEIIAAYVSNNQMKSEDLPNFIDHIHHTLHRILSVQSSARCFPPKPAVSIENTLNPDYIYLS